MKTNRGYVDFTELAVITAVVALAVAIITAPYFLGRHQCSTYQKMTGTPTRFEAAECYVETNEGWIPYTEHVSRVTASGE